MPAGQWTHLAAVFDRWTDVTFYVDGEGVGTAYGALQARPAEGLLWVGGGVNPWLGDLRDGRLYDSELAAEEVAALRLAGLPSGPGVASGPDVADGLDVASEPDIGPDLDLDTTTTSDDMADTDAPVTPTSGSSGCGGSPYLDRRWGGRSSPWPGVAARG